MKNVNTNRALFMLESVAHLRGLERELLPTVDAARREQAFKAERRQARKFKHAGRNA